ncbi:MAG: aminotransferase class IV [Nodosilinea sp.]
MFHWFDGQAHQGKHLAMAVDDPALLYGATVFTTLRVYGDSLDHPLTAWPAHRDRLRQALAAFHWPPPNWDHVRQGAEHLRAQFPVIRITCFPDGRELVTGRPLPPGLGRLQREGIAAWVADAADYQRPLPGYKTGNYLPGWLALQAAQRQGAGEAVLTDSQGQWLETSTGNLWGWADGRWYTPSLTNGLLPGVARLHLIRHLRQQDIAVVEADWNLALVRRLEGLAYSNSVVQAVPIHTVLGKQSRLEFNPQHRGLNGLTSAFDLTAAAALERGDD